MRNLFISVVLFFAAAPAFADSGNQSTYLLNACSGLVAAASGDEHALTNREEIFRSAYCGGYLTAFIQFNQMIKSPDFKAEFDAFCFPNAITTGQLARVAVKFGEDNPKILHLHHFFLVLLAAQDAFPCHVAAEK